MCSSPIGTLLTLLLAIAVAHTKEPTPYQIDHLEHNPGIFYERLQPLRIISKQWQVIGSIDLMAFHEKMTKEIEPHFNQTLQQCETISGLAPDCQRMMKSNQYLRMKKEIEDLKKHLPELFKKGTEQKHKRGLFNIMGTIYNGLFGVMDNDDAEHINSELDKLYNSQSKMTHLVTNSTHIIRSEIEGLMTHMNESNKNMMMLKKAASNLQDEQNKEANEIRELQIAMKFEQIGDEIKHSMEMLLDTSQKIVDAIDAANHGKISHIFLSPDRLHTIAKYFRTKYPKLEFPILEASRGTDYPALSKVSSIQIVYSKGKIIATIRLPLLDKKEYQLYRMHPFRIQQKHFNKTVSAHIQPIKPLIAVSENSRQYTLLDETTLDGCALFRNKLICLPTFAISKVETKPACEIMLLHKPSKDTLRSCDIRISGSIATEWTNIGKSNKWLFATTKPEKGHLWCKEKRKAEISLHETGIITLGDDCYLETPTDTITHIGAIQTIKMDIHIPEITLNIEEFVPSSTRALYVSNELDQLRITPLKHRPNYEIGLDEVERNIAELGLQHRETYQHKLFTFGSLGGLGFVAILGIICVVCVCYLRR